MKDILSYFSKHPTLKKIIIEREVLYFKIKHALHFDIKCHVFLIFITSILFSITKFYNLDILKILFIIVNVQ